VDRANSKNSKYKDCVRYAEHCLNLMSSTKEQDDRGINREMAVEWLRLADIIAHPPKPMK
jgi:hypothetical protein